MDLNSYLWFQFWLNWEKKVCWSLEVRIHMLFCAHLQLNSPVIRLKPIIVVLPVS